MKEQDAEIKRKITRYIEEGRYEQCVDILEEGALHYDLFSISMLANFYTFGQGVKQDDEKAFHYTLLAATMGDPDMMVNLAVFYKNATGTVQDFDQAFYWFSKAAALKQPAAYYGLALCFYYGEGVRQDYDMAAHYASQAIKYPSDYQNLARELLDDLDFEEAVDLFEGKNPPLGLKKLEQLAENGHTQSMVLLSSELSNPSSQWHDSRRAFEYANRAADQDEPAGMYNTALYFWFGMGVEQDKHEAFVWMKNAAKSGYEGAYLPLAQMYLSSAEKASANLEQAVYWAMMAVQSSPENQKASDTYHLAIELYSQDQVYGPYE